MVQAKETNETVRVTVTNIQAENYANLAKEYAKQAGESAESALNTKNEVSDVANKAKDWATKTDGTVDGEDYSAKHYAIVTKQTLENTQITEQNAQMYADNARTSAVNAALSEENALSYKEEAQYSVEQATAIAKSLENAETNASTSESNAALSEENAEKYKKEAEIWANGNDEDVEKLGGTHSSISSAGLSFAYANADEDMPVEEFLLNNNISVKGEKGDSIYIEGNGIEIKNNIITNTRPGEWGNISGDITKQTDLQKALNKKIDATSAINKTSQLVNDSGFITEKDYPTNLKAGVVRTNITYGTHLDIDYVCVYAADYNAIKLKQQCFQPIVPSTLDYAVKTSLCTNEEVLLPDEKDTIHNWLGTKEKILQILTNDEEFSTSDKNNILNKLGIEEKIIQILIDKGLITTPEKPEDEDEPTL